MASSTMGLKLGVLTIFAPRTCKNKCVHDLCMPCSVLSVFIFMLRKEKLQITYTLKIICGLRGACVTCLCCKKMLHDTKRLWMRLFYVFLCVWLAKTQRPPIWATCQDVHGACSGISLVHLLVFYRCGVLENLNENENVMTSWWLVKSLEILKFCKLSQETFKLQRNRTSWQIWIFIWF